MAKHYNEPVNIALLFLLRALLAQEINGYPGGLLKEKKLAELCEPHMRANTIMRYVGNGKNTRLVARPKIYKEILDLFKVIFFLNFEEFSKAFAEEDIVQRFDLLINRKDRLSSYSEQELNEVQNWASHKAEVIFRTNIFRSNDAALTKYLTDLKQLYRMYQLKKGCSLSEEARSHYPHNPDVIRWWGLFHNRTMNWFKVREILLPITTLNVDPLLISNCRLAIFESYLNEFAKEKDKETFKDLKNSFDIHLENVPEKEENGQYHYFKARYYEEEWYMASEEKKTVLCAVFELCG